MILLAGASEADRRVRTQACISFILLTITVCCGSPSPEEQIRTTIGEAAEAAESRDLAALRNLIADTYSDDNGRDKPTVAALVALYLRQNDPVFVFTRIREIEMVSEGSGTAVVLLATAGSPIESAGDLRDLQADLNRLEIELARDGSRWQVTSAKWQPASLADFL